MAPGASKSAAGTSGGQSGPGPLANGGGGAAGVNRKKQKRREKQAARQAAEQQGVAHSGRSTQESYAGNGHLHSSREDYRLSPAPLAPRQDLGFAEQGYDDHDQYEGADRDDLYYSDEEGQLYQASFDPRAVSTNGHSAPGFGDGTGKKSKKKRKAKNAPPFPPPTGPGAAPRGSHVPPPPPPPPPLSNPPARHSMSSDRIWDTSTQEERARIKEYWLSLGEEDRRSLVKLEKEAVLRKMKEQQKQSCSCTVCGRKRTAIEEELEVLYDAYYEELEQYANHQQTRIHDGVPTPPLSRRYGPMGRLQQPDRLPALMNPPSKARVEELADEDDDGDEEDYSDDEDDEDYSDEEPEEEPRGPAAEFFDFGNSLQVKGGILTVAEDLLKNDGKKFIEMMEQLAERRMAREEEAQYVAADLTHPSVGLHGHAGHNHPPQPEDDEYDDEDEDDYDSQEDEDYVEDGMDTMTEEQRMEEGRRMFQIFAARMFEQRVLTAYREKVAQDRQRKLLEELEEETRQDVERELKKAKEAQKKKDKKRLQKQAKDEEKARKDAEKAAEEAAARAVEEKKAEELRVKREEQRKKREAEKKAQEDERLKKEAERLRRLQEERERQADTERKQREQKEQEKRRREEAKKREREEREAREREAREKKERDEKDRKERAQKARQDKEAKERAKREEQAAQQAAAQAAHAAAQAAKRPQPVAPVSAPPPGVPASLFPTSVQSPHLQIATPAIPKAPTPMRPRQASQQGSVSSSPKTPQVSAGQSNAISPVNAASSQTSPGPIGPPSKAPGQPLPTHQPAPPSTMAPPPGMPHPIAPAFSGMPPVGMNGMSGLGHRGPMGHDPLAYAHPQPPIGNQPRAFSSSNIPPFAPGANAMPHSGTNAPRTASMGRAMFMEESAVHSQPTSQPPIGLPTPAPSYTNSMPRPTMPTHSRQQSASFDPQSFEMPIPTSQTHPIARPNPIQRPSSPNHPRGGESHRPSKLDIDDLSNHLGSSALLDDTDDQFTSDAAGNRRGSAVPGPLGSAPRSRFNFGPSMFSHSMGQPSTDGVSNPSPGADNWGAPHMPFGVAGMPGASTWSNNPAGGGWPNANANAFGFIGGPNRPMLSRPVNVRLLICQACKQLTASKKGGETFHEVNAVLRQVDQIRPASEPQVQMREMLDICETEGDAQNGGGFFSIKSEGPGGRTFVKHEVEGNTPLSARSSIPGEIGSPISGVMPTFAGSRSFQPGSGSGMVTPSGF
ncbi:MAG: Stress response protein nst1 [Thelocarpon impressellum]|nr:MAG: Stress response protein nst1 [Thelocarpon impressellum]